MSLKNRRERRRDRHNGGNYSDGGYTSYGSGDGGGFGKRRRGRVAGPIIIACAVIAVLVAADYLMNSDRVYRGVEVGAVSLGGKTPEEAQRIVEDRVAGDLEELSFQGPNGEPISFTAEEMGVDFQVQSTVDEAYAIGREGNVLERLSDRGRALAGGITISPEVRYEPGVAQARVERLAEQMNAEPTEANMEIQGSVVETSESREGYKMDVDATTRNVGAAVDGMSGDVRMAGQVLEPRITTQEAERAAGKAREAMSGEMAFTTVQGNRWTLSPADVGGTLDITRQDGAIEVSFNRDRMNEALAGVYDEIEAEPIEAGYEFAADGSVIVTPSQTGRSIEYDDLLANIESGIFEGQREYELPVVASRPQYTTEQLEAQKPTELLGSYRTDYKATTDQGANRVENLEIASEAVSGTFVAPGDTFSMLDYVTDLDYNNAHVIVENKEEMAEGGGLCQVTSTLYNAALYAGLPVVERWGHNSQLPYIRPGMDATVWYGGPGTQDDLDMKFKNTTDGYVLIQEYVDGDGYMYANVYGVPHNVEVQMSSQKVWMTEDASEWTTSYTRTEDGEVVHEDTWNTEYDALYNEKGKKIPTPKVPIAKVNGTYDGVDFSSLE